MPTGKHIQVTRIWNPHNADAYVKSIYDPVHPRDKDLVEENQRLYEAQRFLHLTPALQSFVVKLFGVTAPQLHK